MGFVGAFFVFEAFVLVFELWVDVSDFGVIQLLEDISVPPKLLTQQIGRRTQFRFKDWSLSPLPLLTLIFNPSQSLHL